MSANDIAISYEDALRARQTIIESNIPMGGQTYLLRPDKAVDLMLDGRAEGSPAALSNGMILGTGAPAIETNYFASGNADNTVTGIFGDLGHVYVGLWADLIVTLDTVSNDAQAVYRFRFFNDHAIPYPKSQCTLTQDD